MNICTVLFFCFVLRKSTAIDVFIIDIPEKDLNDVNESEYIYYDYEQSLAPNLVKNKPLPVNTIGLSHQRKKDQKGNCDRFGSMYGINPNKHKCANLRDKNKRELINAPIYLKPIQYKKIKPILLNQREKKKRKHAHQPRADFSLDYVDDYWRSRPDIETRCSLKDIVTSRCSFRKHLRAQESDSSLSESSQSEETPKRKPENIKTIEGSSEIEDDLPKRKKPNRFKVINKPNDKETSNVKKQSSSETISEESEVETIESVDKVKTNKEIEPYKSIPEPLSETEEDEGEKKVNSENPVSDIEKEIVEYKAPLTDEEEVIQEDPLTELEEEKVIQGDPLTEEEELIQGDPLTELEEEKQEDTLESSFEENRPSSKYQYLQGHRIVKDKDFRRSRMQTFLPKRNIWTAKDIPKLGFFWFDGGPKGF